MLGPLLASFVILPKVGFQTAILLCSFGYLALAVLVVDYSRSYFRRPTAWLLMLLCIGAAIFLFFFPSERTQIHLANARRPYEADGSYLIKQTEGSADTLQLLENDYLGRPYYYRLLTNGFSMSATHPQSQSYMRLFAYLPLALRPEAESVLQICYGVGVTADALTQNPGFRRIDIVDTSREVFALAPYYKGFAEPQPLKDKRVRTFIQDGRFFLQVAPGQYDIITGEPPPLKVAGTVNLYAEEFFQLMKGRLKENGIASFWLPIYQLKLEETKAILKGFHNAFPNASLWASSDYEWIMLGINGPGVRPEPGEMQRLWTQDSTRLDLARIGVEVPERLAALFVMDGAMIEQVTDGVEPLTDFFPKRLSDDLADPKAVQDFARPYLMANAAGTAFRTSEQMKQLWPPMNGDALRSAFILRETRYLASVSGSNWLAELVFYMRQFPFPSPILQVLNTDPVKLEIAQEDAQMTALTKPQVVSQLVAAALAVRNYARATALLSDLEQRGAATPNDLFLLIYLYCLNNEVDKAELIAAAHDSAIEKDWFMKWLWGDLQAEFGFHPPS